MFAVAPAIVAALAARILRVRVCELPLAEVEVAWSDVWPSGERHLNVTQPHVLAAG